MDPIYFEGEGGEIIEGEGGVGGTIIVPGIRTDGGQVVIGRIVDEQTGQVIMDGKIVAEQAHSRTCLASNVLNEDCILVANGSKALAKLLATKKGILITDANGNAAFIQVPDGDAGKNKMLATDANSNLVWVDQNGGV